MPGVCDAEADRRRGYKGKGIIIPKDKFKVFVEFQRRWVEKMIETIEILMEMAYNSGYAVRLSLTQTLTGFAYPQNVRRHIPQTV